MAAGVGVGGTGGFQCNAGKILFAYTHPGPPDWSLLKRQRGDWLTDFQGPPSLRMTGEWLFESIRRGSPGSPGSAHKGLESHFHILWVLRALQSLLMSLTSKAGFQLSHSKRKKKKKKNINSCWEPSPCLTGFTRSWATGALLHDDLIR